MYKIIELEDEAYMYAECLKSGKVLWEGNYLMVIPTNNGLNECIMNHTHIIHYATQADIEYLLDNFDEVYDMLIKTSEEAKAESEYNYLLSLEPDLNEIKEALGE